MKRLLPAIFLYLTFSLETKAQDTLFFSKDSVFSLDEVEVTAKRQEKAISGIMRGRMDLKVGALQSLPKFLGTNDLLRTIQLTPGVQTGGEMNSGLYIRGGESGHNQILFNGAPIYNPMHLLGFFSVFNSDHLSTASLLKSYISPQYGGRAGATIDIQSQQELAEQISVRGTVGLISSQLSAGIPCGDKNSLYLSGRGTYINALLGLIDFDENSIQPQYGFQDYNFTYVSRPTRKSRILLNAYFGKDDMKLKEYYYQAHGGTAWQNAALSLQWEQQLARSRSMSHTVYYSFYNNRIDINLGEGSVQLPSRIRDIGYKGNFRFRMLNCYWTTGIEYASHNVLPQCPEVSNLFSFGTTSGHTEVMHTHEYGIYLQNHLLIGTRWEALTGIRYSGSVSAGSSCRYSGIEPRVSLSYEWRPDRKFLFSYTLQRQYMNQVVVSGIGFPTDFWLPASRFVPAQGSHNLSLGYFQSFADGAYELSVEGYYKHLSNQLEFNGEMIDMVNQDYQIEEHLYYGKGKSYGIEFMLRKNGGRLNGWISYTIGKSLRKFPDINGGNSFPAKNDRRHDLSVTACYKLNRRWDLSAVFVYATGSAFTMPTALYLIGENAVNEYGPHNGARMPDYHRLDLSASYWLKRGRRRESMINFSLYNAYARANPIFLSVSIRPSDDGKSIRISPKGQSLYSLIPSINYSFKF